MQDTRGRNPSVEERFEPLPAHIAALNPFSKADAGLYASQFKYSKVALKTNQPVADAFPAGT